MKNLIRPLTGISLLILCTQARGAVFPVLLQAGNGEASELRIAIPALIAALACAVAAGALLPFLLRRIFRNRFDRKRREQEQQKTDLLLRQVLENLPGYVFIKDAENDFRYLMMNQNCFQFLPDNALGRTDAELFGEEQGRTFRLQDEEILRTGNGVSETEDLKDRGGKQLHIKIFKRLLTKPDGSRIILGTCSDLSREHNLESELEAAIRKLEASVRNEQSINRCLETISSTDNQASAVQFFLQELGLKSDADRCCIFLCSEDGSTVSNTHEWVRDGMPSLQARLQNMKLSAYGSLYETVNSKRNLSIEDTDRPPAGLEYLAKTLRDCGVKSILLYGIWHNSRLLGYAEMNFCRAAHTFTPEDHRRIQDACNFYVLAFDRDRRLKEIGDSAAIQQQIFNNIPMPVLLFDLDYTIRAVNPNTCESIGMPEEFMIGRKCYEALCNHPEPPDWCPMRRTIEERKTVQIEYEGHGHQYIVTTQPVFDRNGKLVNLLEIALDISAQKEQAAQLVTKNQLLNRAADLAKITYFIGNRKAEIKIIGGNAAGFLSAEDVFCDIRPWIIREDRENFERNRKGLMAGKQDIVDMVCRSDSTGERRSYRILVIRDVQNKDAYLGVLQDITDTVAMEEERQTLIRSLNNYVENEKIVNACLSQIVLEDDFDKNVDEILRIIATHLNSDRVYFGAFEDDGKNYHFSHEWLNKGVVSLKTIKDCRFHAQFLKWYDKFHNDELLTIVDIPNSPYSEILREPGCKTLICTPVWVEKKLFGILGVGFIREGRNISELDKNIMRSAARIVALSKEHQMQRAALDSLDRQNRIILTTIPVPVCLFDNKGKLIRSNPAAAALSGSTPADMLTRPCYASLCRENGIPDYCPVHNALKTGAPSTHEIETYGRDCLVTATPIRDREGNITHVLESAIDMTKNNEAKKKLEDAMKAAQAADHAKSYFLATMSHELRTPLNAVIGFSELLKSANLEKQEQDEALDAIHEAGSSLLELINDVLDLSKLEADKMDITPELLNIKAFLESISKIFIPSAKSKNLSFRQEISPDMPEQVRFDRKRLRQVIVNILGNAFKFTREGEVVLTADFKRASKEQGELILSISDTGPGMSQENIHELFIPFKQHHLRDIEGTGLGLVISHRLVEKMNGTIEVESELGKGTVFRVHLCSMEYHSEETEQNEKNAEKEAAHAAQSERILIIDDVEMNLRILDAMLKRIGVKTVKALSAAAALEILRKEHPALIMTDLWMPNMSGIELAEHLVKDPEFAKIPIIAVTADVQISQENRDLFTEILFKPLTLDALKEALDRTLKKPDAK